MFKIQLSPVASNSTTQISVNGDVLTYNGTDYNFAELTVGSEVEAESPAIGVIKNIDGVINIELIYHYDESTAEPMQSTNSNDWIVELTSGTLPNPVLLKEVENV